MTDELEARLRRADPAAAGAPVRPADGPDAGILRRTIMDDEILTSDGTRSRPAPVPLWRRPIVLGAVGAAAAAAVVITVVAVTGGDDDPIASGPTLTYELAGGSGTIAGMCMPVADIEPISGADAFAGTVVSVDDEFVVLDVDRWYAGGGDAARIQLRGADQSVALDGVDFVVGEDYLVTAAQSVVQVCGVSGPATPELEQLYEQWYG